MNDERKTIEIDSAKLAAMGELAAGAGHEINNPLAVILGKAQLLLKDETDPRHKADLQAIAGQALRIKQMIGDLMLFAKPPEVKKKTFDASVAFEKVVERFLPEFDQVGVGLEAEISEGLELLADQTQFEIVASELIRNALSACLLKGEQEGNVQVGLFSEDGEMTLVVEDNGIGFTEKDREHAFDPFYSGRAAGRGLGFGLCKCWRIVEGHGGRIAIETDEAITRVVVLWGKTGTQREQS